MKTTKTDKPKSTVSDRVRADLALDRDNLSEEIVKQASAFFYYAEKKALAAAEVRRLEEQIKVMRSQLTQRAFQKGEKVLGAGVKPTALTVESYYRVQPEYIALKEALNAAMSKSELYDGAVFAMHQKKAMIDNLVHLEGGMRRADSTPSPRFGRNRS